MAKESPQDARDSGGTEDDSLRCVVCEHRISSRSYRMEMSGASEHTFVNPAGIVHTIGCFSVAPGCNYIGETEQAFAWFPGWTWQVAICARCRTHVGWIFRCSGDQFHGLILAAVH